MPDNKEASQDQVQPSQRYSLTQSFWHSFEYLTSYPPYQGVPHLRGNPFTGRLVYMQGKNGVIDNLQQASKLAESSPSGMCSFWVEGKLILLLTKPEDITLFKFHCHPYIDHEVEYWGSYPGHAAINTGKTGLTVRRTYHDMLFKDASLNKLLQEIGKISGEHIQRFQTDGSYTITNAGNYFRGFALELAARLFMGIKDFERVNQTGLLDYLAELLKGPDEDTGLYLLGLKDLPTERLTGQWTQETLDAFKADALAKLKELIFDPHRAEILASNNLFQQFWKLAKEMHGDAEYTIENLFPDAFFFLAGGIIMTTGDCFPIILQLICEHPDVKYKLLTELDRVFSDGKFDPNKIGQLDYLDMIINEAFRLKPPVPIIPARKITTPISFKDIELNAGDCVMVSPLVSHHLASIWKDPEQFNPERFSKENKAKILQGAFIPFGMGPRDCVGRKYGIAVQKTLFAMLLLTFDVKLEYGQDGSQRLAGPTMVTDDMQILLTPRANSSKELTMKI